MLIDIYARSMLTATRHDCVRVRDLSAATERLRSVPPAESYQDNSSGVFARVTPLIKRLATLRGPARRPVRCIDLQNL